MFRCARLCLRSVVSRGVVMCLRQGEIASMTDVDFDKHVAALIVRRLERPKQLTKQNNKYWSEIVSQQYNFDRGTIIFLCAHFGSDSRSRLLDACL